MAVGARIHTVRSENETPESRPTAWHSTDGRRLTSATRPRPGGGEEKADMPGIWCDWGDLYRHVDHRAYRM
jgi:hypothetical protein